MGGIRDMGTDEKYEEYRKKKIIFLREECDPPLLWGAIGRRFGIMKTTAARIYEKAKDEQKKKEEQT